jgi:hypothetical protein
MAGLLGFGQMVRGQQRDLEWFVSPNVNMYIPVNTPGKGTYPILWYDKKTQPKVLVGGFGIGTSVLKPFRENLTLKGRGNVSKQNYWDAPITLTDQNGSPLADFQSSSSDYNLGLAATLHYQLTPAFSAGTGLGTQVLLYSLTRLPGYDGGVNPKKTQVVSNRYYKPVVLVLPVELSLKLEKLLLNVRYEQGLQNRLKSDLAQYQKDRFGILTFEVGFRLK